MPTIYHEIKINAPIETCFDLARDSNIHTQTVSYTKERIARGKKGLLEKGDIVTFEAVHFGIKQRLTAMITEMNKPYLFKDEMVRGVFKSFVHTHEFKKIEGGTIMIDIFEYEVPLGMLGFLANNLFLEKYMNQFISGRALELKNLAEKT